MIDWYSFVKENIPGIEFREVRLVVAHHLQKAFELGMESAEVHHWSAPESGAVCWDEPLPWPGWPHYRGWTSDIQDGRGLDPPKQIPYS